MFYTQDASFYPPSNMYLIQFMPSPHFHRASSTYRNGAKGSKDSKMNEMPLDLYTFYSFLWQLKPVIRFVPDFHHFVPSLKPQKKLGFAFNMPCLTQRNTIETDPTKLIFIVDMFLRILCMILYRKAYFISKFSKRKIQFLPQKLVWFFLSFLFLKWKG